MKDSTIEYTKKALEEALVDIDIEYCKKHNIKFKDTLDKETEDEIWARLGNKEITKRAFDIVTRNKKNE